MRATTNALAVALTTLVIATAPHAELLETLEGDVRGLAPPASLAAPGAPAASFLLMSAGSHRDLRDAPGALLIFTDGGVLIAIADDDAPQFVPWRRDPQSFRPLRREAAEGARCLTGTESDCWHPGDPVPYSTNVADALGVQSLPIPTALPSLNQSVFALICASSVGFSSLDHSACGANATPVPLVPLASDPGLAPRPGTSFPLLSDAQQALLGCGAFYGTDCASSGIDLRNAESSVLLQSWVGFDGTYSDADFGNGFSSWRFGGGLAQPGSRGPGDPGYDPPDQVFRSEMAALSFNMQNLLVAFSVPSDANVVSGWTGHGELDAANPFSRAPGQCSFAQPMNCTNNRALTSLSVLDGDGHRQWLWESGAEYRVVDAFGDVGDYAGGVVHVLGVEESRTREASLGVPIALFPPAGRTLAGGTRFATSKLGDPSGPSFGFAYLTAPEPSDAALAIAAIAALAAIDRRRAR